MSRRHCHPTVRTARQLNKQFNSHPTLRTARQLNKQKKKMSIYASSSSSYWGQKKSSKKSPLIASIFVFAIAAIGVAAVLHHKKRSNDGRTLAARRSLADTNGTHWKICESRVNSREDCTAICQAERNSIQRKTMVPACLHGCQQAHVASTSLACRGKVTSEGEVFQEIGGLAYVHCSKFQAVDPKPDVFATCRKYHRAGTKKGFAQGSRAIAAILDEEWIRAQEEAIVESM